MSPGLTPKDIISNKVESEDEDVGIGGWNIHPKTRDCIVDYAYVRGAVVKRVSVG